MRRTYSAFRCGKSQTERRSKRKRATRPISGTELTVWGNSAGGGAGATNLVLVSGYSGIGKSSVVNELQPVLVPPRGLFASRKFDQYKRDIPYATLAQAFQSLIRHC